VTINVKAGARQRGHPVDIRTTGSEKNASSTGTSSPLIVHHDTTGGVYADVELVTGYEEPPGHINGGMCALILDHILGATAHLPGRPDYTGTLTVRYLRPTRLDMVHAQASVDRVEGRSPTL
jgi:Thioesterase superfamily